MGNTQNKQQQQQHQQQQHHHQQQQQPQQQQQQQQQQTNIITIFILFWTPHEGTISNSKKHMGKANKANKTHILKLVWLTGSLSQTSLNIFVVCSCLFLLFFSKVVCFLCSCAALCCGAALRSSAPLICSALHCAALRFALWANHPFSK